MKPHVPIISDNQHQLVAHVSQPRSHLLSFPRQYCEATHKDCDSIDKYFSIFFLKGKHSFIKHHHNPVVTLKLSQ